MELVAIKFGFVVWHSHPYLVTVCSQRSAD